MREIGASRKRLLATGAFADELDCKLHDNWSHVTLNKLGELLILFPQSDQA